MFYLTLAYFIYFGVGYTPFSTLTILSNESICKSTVYKSVGLSYPVNKTRSTFLKYFLFYVIRL